MKPRPHVTVGRVVELTEDERHEIYALAERMRSVSRRQQLGWLTVFVQDLTRLNRVIHSAVSRSHAS
jgi:hypothetical protein